LGTSSNPCSSQESAAANRLSFPDGAVFLPLIDSQDAEEVPGNEAGNA
jgi:hypothetical protein